MDIHKSTIDYINQLLAQVPELCLTYNEHIHANDKLLPHVFLGDVTRYVVQQVRSGEMTPSKPAGRILTFLEQGIVSGDDQVKELIWVSFVENIAEHAEVLAYLRDVIGPNLANCLKSYGK